jgi:16S rRNA (adenine1518-N6/adenine1519-N6)-dimethyltransferase
LPRTPGNPPALKRLGQHFLTDQAILGRIAEAVAPGRERVIVEIGPGRGALTDLLQRRTDRLIAIELDRMLVPILRERYANDTHVTIVEADVLETDLGALAGDDYVLAGNVPYYITTPILFHALKPPRPRRAIYLVQREVAERIQSGPGSGEYGALSVNVQAVADAAILFNVPARAFSPPPRVESAVVSIVPRETPLIEADKEENFRGFVRDAFGLRRKQLKRVLRTILRLDPDAASALLARSGLDPEARPETLSPAEFVRLFRDSRVVSGQAER